MTVTQDLIGVLQRLGSLLVQMQTSLTEKQRMAVLTGSAYVDIHATTKCVWGVHAGQGATLETLAAQYPTCLFEVSKPAGGSVRSH